MSSNCALCNAELTSMDTLLGENKLSDGSVLCNACLEKVSSINQELLDDLKKFSIEDVKGLAENRKEESDQAIEENTDFPVSAVRDPQSFISNDVYKRRLKEIKYQLDKVGANLSMFTRGEIKALPRILAEDELILAATDAQFINTVDAGILLVTPTRMLSVSKSMFDAVKVAGYPNETIREISFVPNRVTPFITLHTEDGEIRFECFRDREDAERFYNFVKKIYNQPKQLEQPEQPKIEEKVTPSETLYDQLEKLGKLRESGILTEEEFAEQKKKLLG
ncbi:SHOCT domain-containing protein [Chryseobacterium vaccae]|uniref:SHOCT domain-containing protein n=1 Tax=Chryseobacterium vaccae TaxID=2604424 RepID=UPI001295BA9B|nr:SHOCT domain-containing protein [Chryseobacterium vaccae]